MEYNTVLDLPDDEDTVFVEVDDDALDDDLIIETIRGENIAVYLIDNNGSRLNEISQDLMERYREDRASRQEWEEKNKEGINILGLEYENRSKPFKGASGAYHPVVLEQIIQYQSRAITKMFPLEGPAEAKILGPRTKEKDARALRVKNYTNYYMTEVMTDYRAETEYLLMLTPLFGSAFRKIYDDPSTGVCVAKTISPEDIVVPYGTTDIRNCERIAHICPYSKYQFEDLISSGLYIPVEPEEYSEDMTASKEAVDLKLGFSRPMKDDRVFVIEFHVRYVIPEISDSPLNYIISIEASSEKVISIYENNSDDIPTKKNEYFVGYKFFPGFSVYGMGLATMIGGLGRGATAALRQLLDAGQLANLKAGFKSRDLRLVNSKQPLAPGEFRDVEGTAQQLKDGIIPLNFGEPSSVLFNLMQLMVEEARRIGSFSDSALGTLNANAPVGTTLAILERADNVNNAMQMRLHESFARELRILKRLISQKTPQPYPYAPDEQFVVQEDFSDIEIVPVSDPRSSGLAARIMKYQTFGNFAAQYPASGVVDLVELHKEAAIALDIDNPKLIIDPKDIKRRDPVSENMSLMNGQPVKAFLDQDHEAHIRVHKAALEDPMIAQIIGQSPAASQIMSAAYAHIAEHTAMAYRAQVASMLGVDLPDPEQELDPDLEREVSVLVADAAQKVFQANSQRAAAIKQEQIMNDPVSQMQERELRNAEKETELKQQKLLMDQEERKRRFSLELAKMSQDEKETLLTLAADLIKADTEITSKQQVSDAQMALKAMLSILDK